MSEQLRTAIHGVGVTPVTPFTSDLSAVDLAALGDNLAYLIQHGVGLVYVAGNTGEGPSLSPDEWTTVVETALTTAGDAVVVAGIGHEYPVALELARRAKSLGVAGVLAMPRMQPHMGSYGLVAYWLGVIEAAGLPAVVYKRTLPEPDDLSRLLSHELVIGCKYAERDVSEFASTVADDQSGVLWTCGIAERYAPYFHAAGSVGFTSGLANFAPKHALGLQRALRAGDASEAMERRAECLPIEAVRARHGDLYNVSAVKRAMDAIGLRGGPVRPPLVDLDSTTAEEVAAIARQMSDRKEAWQ